MKTLFVWLITHNVRKGEPFLNSTRAWIVAVTAVVAIVVAYIAYLIEAKYLNLLDRLAKVFIPSNSRKGYTAIPPAPEPVSGDIKITGHEAA